MNHQAALGLYFPAYNFIAKHSTIKTTPAVAANLADHAWSAEELIERTADYNPVRPLPPPKTLSEFIDRLLPDDED